MKRKIFMPDLSFFLWCETIESAGRNVNQLFVNRYRVYVRRVVLSEVFNPKQLVVRVIGQQAKKCD